MHKYSYNSNDLNRIDLFRKLLSNNSSILREKFENLAKKNSLNIPATLPKARSYSNLKSNLKESDKILSDAKSETDLVIVNIFIKIK